MNENCDICKIIHSTNDDVVIMKTKFWRIALQTNQAYLGQSFITLLEHKGGLSDLTHEEWSDFEALLRGLESAIKVSFGATHFNWSCLMNEAYRFTTTEPHVHWHVFPRYSQTVSFSDVDFEDLEFGQHYVNRQFRVTHDVLEAIGTKIKTQL